MKRTLIAFAIAAAVVRAALPVASFAAAAVPEDLKRLLQDDLRYEGSFRLPEGNIGQSTFGYGGTALAFNPARKSLYLVGHDQHQLVAEVGIPALRKGMVRELAVAPVLQPFADPSAGRLPRVNAGGSVKIGGLFVHENRLLMSAYEYYDATNTQVASHFIADLDLAKRDGVKGPYQVGRTGFCGTPNGNCAGFVDGYFGSVPAEWRDAFGGPIIIGQCCIPILGRTSYGPSLFVIDPANLGGPTALPATPLVYYGQANPLAPWDSTNEYFNGTSEVRGVVFPEGTRTVLFFGRHGAGTFCYGNGSNDAEVAKGSASGACYDPTSPYKGTHAYPYNYYAWAYDAVDLAAVKERRKQPWAVKPYAVWKLSMPFQTLRTQINGVAYDPQTGRIFLSQAFADGDAPVIHAFTVRKS